jgi:hypothetical protein
LTNAELYGLEVLVAGWGRSNDGEIPFVMETGTLTVLSKEECEERAQRLQGPDIIIHESVLCTASEPSLHLSFVRTKYNYKLQILFMIIINFNVAIILFYKEKFLFFKYK